MSCKVPDPDTILNGALALIGRPASLLTRKGDLFDILEVTLELYRSKMSIHDGNFILKKRVVTLPARQIEVSFQDSDWGRPVCCDLDPASLPQGMLLPRRDVELVAIQDLDQFRNSGLPATSGAANLTAISEQSVSYAQAVAWFRQKSKIMLFFEFGGFFPIAPVTYRFFYEPGGMVQVLKGEEVDWLPNFIGLLQCHFALLMLPLATDISDSQYSRFENRLSAEVAQRTPILDTFLQLDHTEQAGYYAGYGRSRSGGRQRAR